MMDSDIRDGQCMSGQTPDANLLGLAAGVSGAENRSLTAQFSTSLLLSPLQTQWLTTVDSTNTESFRSVRRLSGGSFLPFVVATDCQTAGRGRQGRRWLSQPGRSLCFSYVCGLPLGIQHKALIPIAAGWAVASYVRNLGVKAQLKWPNDILVSGKKLAGILCESQSLGGQDVVVVGVGINVRPVAHPSKPMGMSLDAVALDQVCNLARMETVMDLPMLAQNLGEQIHEMTQQVLHSGLTPWLQALHEVDAWRGQQVNVIEQGQVLVTGRALGIDVDGHYLLDTARGIEAIVAGDLSLRLA